MCTNFTESSHSKRKALELITNIFRKKSKESLKSWNETENYPPVPIIDSNHEDERVISIITPPEPQPSTSFQHSSDHLSDYGIPPHSPVSPRVKNIDEDMEALTLSRQDNPFIVSKLEKLSTSEDWLSPTASSLTIQQELLSPSSCSSSLINQNNQLQQSIINMEIGEITLDESNLHQHLIRSPPPQFPTKLAHFIFPLPNSPIKNLSSRYGAFLSPDRRSETRSIRDHYRSGPINLPSSYLSPSSSSSSSSPNTIRNPAEIKFQSTHSLTLKSPKLQSNCYRKNSIATDKLIVQPSASTSKVETIKSNEVRRASTSGSFRSDLSKLSAQSTKSIGDNSVSRVDSEDISVNQSTINQEAESQSNEDNQTRFNDTNWNHNLSNSREALISKQSASNFADVN